VVSVFGPANNGISQANCNAGDIATGGGFQDAGLDTPVTASFPVPVGVNPPTGWFVSLDQGGLSITSYVVCLDLTP
jgi:hypothetical protein